MKKNVFRECQSKEAFVNRLSIDVKHREELRKFFNTTFQEIVSRFDGKVYNKKVESAINAALQAVNPLFFCKCEIKSRESYSNYPDNNYVEVILNAYHEKGNYTNYQSLYTKIMLVSDDNYNLRVAADMGKDEKFVISWAENFDKYTEEMKAAIKKYDKFIKVAQKVADAIDDFSELPQEFRNNIAFSYLFYLK